ncbi:carbohydrate ABC transporter permease [Microbispora rosea]|uniref:Carbohydrate ABC transporter membrane protein 2, CUT1 family n=1 Tax=Microbispora rosea TaxID=58117 RepID=A0A1N7HCF8_9ACTN|nr:carbohydrate ABC transporter permease [Microbispora rosea]GIH52502.1 putative sugar ABC transporter, permease protein [Microbispora rosea subsp. rosea]SIS22378.1 carbohydrate ABC transporter membrane protein 2, CUT1 family [Microbispora rosea]
MKRTPITRIALYLVLFAGAVVSVAPYLMTLNSAFKEPAQVLTTPAWQPAFPVTFDNFAQVWSEYDMAGFLLHSLIYAGVVTAGQVVFSTMAAYAFGRMSFPGRDALFWGYLATMMVPQIVTLVPLFLIMREFGLIDTYLGLILPTAFGTPYGIFLVRQYFRTIPRDLESAARIDGAGTLTVLVRVLLPLSRPILATLATITFITTWNTLLWPLIVTNGDATRVVTLGISALKGQYSSQYHLILAAAALALLPLIVIFLLFQRHIVRSIALTGLK